MGSSGFWGPRYCKVQVQVMMVEYAWHRVIFHAQHEAVALKGMWASYADSMSMKGKAWELYSGRE